MKFSALSAFCLLFFVFCQTKNEPPKLPQTPEQVVRLWQESIDKNNFALARRLCTGEALAYVNNELAPYSTADSLEWEDNVLFNLRCQVFGDSAHCTYYFEDEVGEPDPGELALLKIKGQWLVHRIEFDGDLPADSLERAREDMISPEDSTDVELE